MRRLRYAVLGVLLSISAQGHAAGWPVIDVANLGQLLEQYAVENSQLAEEIQQYSQMLTEYQTMLENLQGFDTATLQQLFDVPQQFTEDFILNQPVRDIVNLDPNDPNFQANVEVLYKQQYTTPDTNWRNRWGGMFDQQDQAGLQAQVDELMDEQARQRGLFEGAAKNNEKYARWDQTIGRFKAKGSTLGPNRQAEAMQLQAAQANLALTQQQELVQKIDAMILRQEEQERRATEARIKSREYELETMRRMTSQTYNEPPANTWLAQ